MKKKASSYQAKVTNDTGIARSRVPSSLLKLMGARPGDYAVFNYKGATVVMSIKRAKGKAKAKTALRRTKE